MRLASSLPAVLPQRPPEFSIDYLLDQFRLTGRQALLVADQLRVGYVRLRTAGRPRAGPHAVACIVAACHAIPRLASHAASLQPAGGACRARGPASRGTPTPGRRTRAPATASTTTAGQPSRGSSGGLLVPGRDLALSRHSLPSWS